MNELRPAVTRATVEAVMDSLLDDGVTLKRAVKLQGITISQFNWYLQKDKEAAVALIRAQELRADVYVDETIEFADGNGDPAKVRNQIMARHWAAERQHQKKYGQRVDLNVTATLDVGGTLAEARARLLRPVRDQLTDDSPQVLDLPVRMVADACNAALAADEKPAAPLVPDIFS